jgi:hypothetical protein
MKTLAVVLALSCASFAAASDEVATALHATDLLRAKMRDPDSLVIEHVYAKVDHKPDHPLMCIPYRSHNAFGGYSHGVAEYKGGNNLNAAGGESVGWCLGIERNLDKRLKKGWVDLTDEYFKAAKEAEQH